jgi:putative endonuclease
MLRRRNPWCLYLLECEDGSLYCGITNDSSAVSPRTLRRQGRALHPLARPRRIVARRAFPDRASASRAEYALKQLDAAGKRAFAQPTRTRLNRGRRAAPARWRRH